MKLLILGPHKSGKDVCASILQNGYGFQYEGSTSIPLIEAVKDHLEDFPWGVNLTYENRHSYAMDLYKAGHLLRLKYGNLFLVNKLLEQGSELIVGLREKNEMNEAIRSEMFRRVLWIHRPDHTEDPTMEFTIGDVMEAVGQTNKVRLSVVVNRGPLERYNYELVRLFDLLFGIAQ